MKTFVTFTMVKSCHCLHSLGGNNLHIRVSDEDIGQFHLRNLDHWLHQDDERSNIQ